MCDFNNCSNLANNDSNGINEITPCASIPQDIILAAALITTVIGLIGNTVTIVVIVATKQHKKSVATCFVLNLAVADDLFIIGLPLQAYINYTGKWTLGEFMCKLHFPTYGINLFASIFTMSFMSIDRYLAIREPIRSIGFKSPKKAFVICIIIWLLCFVINIPLWHFADVSNGVCFLSATKMGKRGYNAWKIVQLLLGFVIPLFVMMICYSCLIYHLKVRRIPSQNQVPSHLKNVTCMVFLVTVIFIICWTPWHIVKFAHLIPVQHIRDNYCVYNGINVVAQLLVFFSCCCNPFIYWISGGKFSKYTL